MDFELGEEQVMLKTAARDFLDKECPKTLVREMLYEDEKGYSPALWKKMADLGWMGLIVPEEHGGVGSSFLDLAVLLEEMGRALVPGPFIETVLVGNIILAAGTEKQKKEFLPKIANGDITMTLALMELSGSLEASAVTLEASPSREDYILEGTKLFVPSANTADYTLCVARTTNCPNKEDGITLFLVDNKTAHIHTEVLKTMTNEKMCEVIYRQVTVPAENIIGELDNGWCLIERALLEAAVAESAWMMGGARWALDTSVEYAKERIQFGVPIGSFQAIQHKLVDMVVGVEGATNITYYAAWAVAENAPDVALAASMAKAWCSDMYKKVAGDGIQVHGGIGFTWDHDMHLYFKRAKASEVAYGDANYHRDKVAEMIDI